MPQPTAEANADPRRHLEELFASYEQGPLRRRGKTTVFIKLRTEPR